MSDELIIYDVEQGSPDWHAVRAGIPTASEIHKLTMKGRSGEPSKTRREYQLRLLGERITGAVIQTWSGNEHTERGHLWEPEARALYGLLREVRPQTIGFMRRGRVGASPDSLIGEEGLLEIKTKLPHLVLDCALTGLVPADHIPQIQTQLWISGRKWCDFLAYWRGLPPFICRVERDDAYIATLDAAATAFNDELDQLHRQYLALQEAA